MKLRNLKTVIGSKNGAHCQHDYCTEHLLAEPCKGLAPGSMTSLLKTLTDRPLERSHWLLAPS